MDVRKLPSLFLVCCCLAAVCAAQAPEVGPEFQRSIDRAWKEASDGESPSKACAGLKGSVHGRIRYQGQTELLEKATRAIQVCELEIPVRYFETYLDSVAAGKNSCTDFMSHFETEMGGVGVRMTSIESIEPKGTRDLVLKALAERIRKQCPDVAPFMLRGIAGGGG